MIILTLVQKRTCWVFAHTNRRSALCSNLAKFLALSLSAGEHKRDLITVESYSSSLISKEMWTFELLKTARFPRKKPKFTRRITRSHVVNRLADSFPNNSDVVRLDSTIVALGDSFSTPREVWADVCITSLEEIDRRLSGYLNFLKILCLVVASITGLKRAICPKVKAIGARLLSCIFDLQS